MSPDERKDSLKEKHQALEHEIETEEGRPYPDDVHLHDLKKQKLYIKDQISQI
jgi:hypothetical protein